TTVLDLPAGSRSFEQAHTYQAAGSADVVLRLRDDNGGDDVGTASVNVVSPAPAQAEGSTASVNVASPAPAPAPAPAPSPAPTPARAIPNLALGPPRGGGEPEANNSVPQPPLPSPRVAQTVDGEVSGNLVRVVLGAGNEAKGFSPPVPPANPQDT